MSRFRLYPTAAQQAALLEQCGHARYVWNLALEQRSMWTRDKANRRRRVQAALAKLHARAGDRRKEAAGRVERTNPASTSQTCSVCGHCAPGKRENQAVFRCIACGHRADADVNAAVNIAAGRAVSARRETLVGVSPKREPQLTTSP